MILVNYLEFDIVDVNESFCTLLGYEREKLVGTSYYDLEFWAEAEQAEWLLEKLQSEGEATVSRAAIRKKNGDEIVLQMLVRLISLEAGQFVLATGHDLGAYGSEEITSNRWIDVREVQPGIQARIGEVGDVLNEYVHLIGSLNEPLQKESALRQLHVLCATSAKQIELLLVETSALQKVRDTSVVATDEAKQIDEDDEGRTLLPPKAIELTTKITSLVTELLKLFGL